MPFRVIMLLALCDFTRPVYASQWLVGSRRAAFLAQLFVSNIVARMLSKVAQACRHLCTSIELRGQGDKLCFLHVSLLVLLLRLSFFLLSPFVLLLLSCCFFVKLGAGASEPIRTFFMCLPSFFSVRLSFFFHRSSCFFLLFLSSFIVRLDSSFVFVLR